MQLANALSDIIRGSSREVSIVKARRHESSTSLIGKVQSRDIVSSHRNFDDRAAIRIQRREKEKEEYISFHSPSIRSRRCFLVAADEKSNSDASRRNFILETSLFAEDED